MNIPTFDQNIQWIAGGAQGHFPKLYDREKYLCAVALRGGRWDFAVVTVCVDDSEDEVWTELEVEEEPWAYDWDDVTWYVPLKFLCPPSTVTLKVEE